MRLDAVMYLENSEYRWNSLIMKNSDFNKMLGIGPGGINCGCCIDFPKKRQNHKKLYRRLKRKIEKIFFQREIKDNTEGQIN